jgi:hypothetical protein
MLKQYLQEILDVAICGDATEESYYSALERLLQRFRENLHITTLPKKTEAGNPDFRVWDGKLHIVGYIEAKAPTVENLDSIERSEQLGRYRQTFPNLILTNFFEFRLYRYGESIGKVTIARPYVINKLKTEPPIERQGEFKNLLQRFLSFSLPQVLDAKNLAVELAKRTRFLKDEVIAQELKIEQKVSRATEQLVKSHVAAFYEIFKEHLITNLTKEDFADLYSQTITYGLFAARTRHTPPSHPYKGGFNRKLAYDNIPQTIGILRDVFRFISFGDLPKQMEWIVDDISEVLAVTDVYKLLDEYFHQHKGKDPIVHFYETFLAEYDPKTREKRGVYYTPEPVVSYIVRSINCILREHFNKDDGFANTSITVLDPAAGTLTFLAETAKLAITEFTSKYGEGGRERFIKEHILKNFYAFELMMAPYAVGHLKISFLLEELGYKLCEDDRFNLYLTNTLEMEELAQTQIPGMASLSEESHRAGVVKREQPILVILGNPPYSGHSSNVGDWISKEIKAYFQVDGKPLKEKNPKWLQDDYVKFIRFAQWKIDNAGEGILGFITNHSYLDNPTFRGMRQSLMQSFHELYLFDLHGNSLKKEKGPDGGKDENVFDIQQGVALALFVKKKGLKKKVSHAALWGLREEKYNWLNNNDVKTTKWKTIKPKSEFYLFIPRDERLLKQYQTYPKITDIFPVNSVGIVTARDGFAVDYEEDVLKRNIRMFSNDKIPDEIIRQTFKLPDTSKFKLKDAREIVRKDFNWTDAVIKVLYRPFDTRYIFYHDAVIERPRREVMQHMVQENLGLVAVRQVAEGIFNHTFVSNCIIESRVTLSNKGIAYFFPLYLYQSGQKEEVIKRKRHFTFGSSWMLFETEAEYFAKKPNVSEALLSKLSNAFNKEPQPEQIFNYIYAVLYSNSYRTKYAEFLKIDFPRTPFTSNYKLFEKLADFGKRLVDLHLLKSAELAHPITRFQGKGDNKVEKLRYDKSVLSPFKKGERKGVVYINKEQYFENVPSHVWEYRIGGYQVCEKWLKDRKGRVLSLSEIQTYCRIITSLQKTIEIQKAIDELYPLVEKEIISSEDV